MAVLLRDIIANGLCVVNVISIIAILVSLAKVNATFIFVYLVKVVFIQVD